MKFGTWGEEIASKHLQKKGYAILERNFRCKMGELDIIAQKGELLVFIEVKTRNNLNYGLPCEAITLEKKHHIKRVSTYYIRQHQLENLDLRIDVIEILKIEGKTYIHHLEDAF